MKLYSKEDQKSLNTFKQSKDYLIYKIKSDKNQVVIDNIEGIGASHTTRDILKKGFISLVDPLKLASLCGESLDSTEVSSYIQELVSDGDSVANTILYLDIDGYVAGDTVNSRPRVLGFDNFDTAIALHSLGFKQIPLQCVILGYSTSVVKGRNSFKTWINSSVFSLNRTRSISNVFISLSFG